MIHGYDDSTKEKAGQVVCIEEGFTVDSSGEIVILLDQSNIESYGIEDISDWTVIGLMKDNPSYTDYTVWEMPSFNTTAGKMNITAMLNTNPSAVGRISVQYFGASGNHKFRLVLMKVA